MPDSSAAYLAAATAAEIDAATDSTIATAADLLARVTTADATDIELLDRFDEGVATLSNLSGLLGLIGRAHPGAEVRTAADAAFARVSGELSAVTLNPAIFAILDGLDVSGEDAATRYYVDRTLRDFRRAGVDRDDATRDRVRQLQDELTDIGTAFGRNIQEDVRTGHFPPSALDGLPADFVANHPVGEDGTVAITTDYPDIRPFLSYSTDASARETMWRISRQRGYPVNVDVLERLIQRRYELATLLGYGSWAQFVTETKMIGTDKAAAEFIERITELSTARAADDYAELLLRKRLDDPGAEAVFPWDVSFLEDRLKAEKLAFDTQAVRPYFEYSRVKSGLMALVERMFGIVFRPAPDVPVWHPEVEVFDVAWADGGAPLGRIFLDMHPRPGKYQHAAMFNMRTGNPARGRLPECALLCNFPKPGQTPALLLHSDVTTFFHEFGHLIHHIIGGHQRWSGISGIQNERDFVEAPSQLLEEWTFDAGTLAEFAVHHETGEPLPAEMVAKLRAADEFGKGMQVRQQMYYAALSLELFRRDPDGLDPVAVDSEAMAAHTAFRHVDGTYMHLSFGHLVGYSAVYYTYMWSLVIAKDLFTRFTIEGLPAPEATRAYRDSVLAPGGSAPAAELVRDFLGRNYTFDAYQQWLDAD